MLYDKSIIWLKEGNHHLEVVKLPEFTRISAIDIFENEVDKLFNKSTDEKKKYFNFLYAELIKIDNRCGTIAREEPITYKGYNLYSIRKKMKKNTRVLYYCCENNTIILLTAFDEKGKDDYERGKQKALKRLKKLKII